MNTPRYTIESKTIKVQADGKFWINPTDNQKTYNIMQPGALGTNDAYPAIKEINPTSTDNNNSVFYHLFGYWGMSLEEISYVSACRIVGSREFWAEDATGNPVATGTDIQVLIVNWTY